MSRKQYWVAAPHDVFPSGEAFYMEDGIGQVYWNRRRSGTMCVNTIEEAREIKERALKHNSDSYIVKWKTTITRTVVE